MPRYNRTITRHREIAALALAVEGRSWSEIGHTLGYAQRSGAWKAAQRALRRQTLSAGERYLAAQLVDLNCLIEKHWPAAVSGSTSAADVVLRAMDRRWRLYELVLAACATCGGDHHSTN